MSAANLNTEYENYEGGHSEEHKRRHRQRTGNEITMDQMNLLSSEESGY